MQEDFDDSSDVTSSEDDIEMLQNDDNSTVVQQVSKDFTEVFVVEENDKITSNMMTLYEFTSVVGIYSQMINDNGSAYATKNGLKNLNAKDIALLELEQRICPLIVCRQIGDRIEKFKVSEMIYPNVFIEIWGKQK